MFYTISRTTILAAIFFVFPIYTTHGVTTEQKTIHLQPAVPTHPYDSLINKLVADGFDRTELKKIFSDPRVAFMNDVLTINLANRYVKADYSRFLQNQSINHARKFLAQESNFLTTVEKRFQVDKEVIVSILFIESAFGKRTGNNIVFNVFSTLSRAIEPDILQTTTHLLKERYPQMSAEEIEQRAHKKAQWAYQELKHLLTIAEKEHLDVLKIKGSWAGAFGIAQFLPSSYVRYAVDGNNDHKVRLYNRYDSIVSVANYLKENGWKKGLTEKRKRTIIRKYNNSTPYIDTVLQLSQKITG
jgi:membrane-bound lytic murein transglycosylase B